MSKIKNAPPAPLPAASNLFITVKTFAADTGKDIGFRVVDLFHYGTTRWMQSHNWWAMQNGHVVEIANSTPPEVEHYLATAKQALADKFNNSPAPAESVIQQEKDAAGELLAKAA